VFVKTPTENDPRTYAIIGAAMEVHRQLGCGFLEAVYQEALAIELLKQNIPFRREVRLPIHYKDHLLLTAYCADFICFDSVVIELKALAHMSGTEEAQVINYLKATGYEVGLLLNFGARSLQHRRFVLSKSVESAKSADSFHG
jgi:GxxExxY protein